MKILIIEDEPEVLENTIRTLEREHYIVKTATDYQSIAKAFLEKYWIKLTILLRNSTFFKLVFLKRH